MKSSGIEHVDYFDDESVFWVNLSDLPQDIQAQGKAIDGEEYNATCFGMCISHYLKEDEFVVVEDSDTATGNPGQIYYIDNDGNYHWMEAKIPEDFCKQIFAACAEINAGRGAINGYEIKRAIVFDNSRGFVLAENPKAAQPFVTKRFTEDEYGRRDYSQSRYMTDRGMATMDYESRAAEYQKYHGLSVRSIPTEQALHSVPKYYDVDPEMAIRAKTVNTVGGYIVSSPELYRARVDQAHEQGERQKQQVDPAYHGEIDSLVDTFARKLADNFNKRNAIHASQPPASKAAHDQNTGEYLEISGLLNRLNDVGHDKGRALPPAKTEPDRGGR